jgi:chromosome segregation ATPase
MLILLPWFSSTSSQADQVLASQDSEIKNLRRTLMEAEAAQHQQKRIYDDVVQERDILGTQLIRRNDELALLYEKIRIQQSTLNKGEEQYRNRLMDVRRLKLEMNSCRRQLQIRSHEVTNIESLKNEVYHVQRELLQERTKVKALSEELENPMNVHRWRKLEGADPKRYELIQKIQTLQKRLIQKTESVVEKDLLLQEKEKLYVELKNLLARQPGPEVAEQLSKYQHTLKEKTRQMKAMAAELNMLQAQVNEYRYEIERTTRELQDTKRKFFESRRKEQHQERKEAQQIDPMTEQQRMFLATQPRITGGGFNLQAMMNATQ